ncbi:hypothetical protein M422DRAFT_31752, partial [Sphaerobolus stellatus SS14]
TSCYGMETRSAIQHGTESSMIKRRDGLKRQYPNRPQYCFRCWNVEIVEQRKNMFECECSSDFQLYRRNLIPISDDFTH